MKQWKQVERAMAEAADKVLEKLVHEGYEAYYVGGSVRDEWMGRPVNDLDITTSARPEQVLNMFERTVPTGMQHGTVTVIMDQIPFEVTTFRKETGYEDHRRPSEVEFVQDVEQDLKRRDFTMNAMAMDRAGRLIDPFGGRKDIKEGLVRCVGKADERFEEDALRMLRAIRFASIFNFVPSVRTWQGLIHNRASIQYIAVERIRAELEKIIAGPHPLRGLELLERSGLMKYTKIAMKSSAISKSEAELLEKLPSSPAALRWSYIVQWFQSEVKDLELWLKSWTFPSKMIEAITKIIYFDLEIRDCHRKLEQDRLHTRQSDYEGLRRAWITLQLKYGQVTASHWLVRERLLSTEKLTGNSEDQISTPVETSQNLTFYLPIMQQWCTEVPLHSAKELNISGSDVIVQVGRPAGPWVSETMQRLVGLVAAGDLKNERAALLEELTKVENGYGK
ncbi:tRNA nucleotidyltransferase (CCA-adding enzyme) [Paenibacillus shirakamiensis]|uniref:tRNA nucleotidyltransferase (CCA-adding enzyme) n=1 Tax=Paenibacillus shirakamiensis TaxID=1265935 RepID=A0ABS4JCZ6_9BACL|nr:CCA tRNA nucleotidyltransferase [Paenibacillus shirakamiensis]MBP1999573.1 tRNA nucleotidyltransferase (CCA-adding enzyme) [Paenibacillus shirakamiensis]